MGTENLSLVNAASAAEIAAVRELWREYWGSFGLSTDFQGFAGEMEGLPGAYGAQGGALLLATCDERPAGTIALRRLDALSGEIKRLYLKPEFRGRGLGRRLLETVIERGRSLGYEALFADTLPVMTDALTLYQRMGFERVQAYSSHPTPGAIYLKLHLVRSSGLLPASSV